MTELTSDEQRILQAMLKSIEEHGHVALKWCGELAGVPWSDVDVMYDIYVRGGQIPNVGISL